MGIDNTIFQAEVTPDEADAFKDAGAGKPWPPMPADFRDRTNPVHRDDVPEEHLDEFDERYAKLSANAAMSHWASVGVVDDDE